jgi:protein ImuB
MPEAGEPPARPIQFFEPPQRIEVGLFDVPDGPPQSFRWRRVLHMIAYAEGPERIAPEWWHSDKTSESHDYYRVEDMEGRRFWIFRSGILGRETNDPSQWFLRGLFA